MRSCLSCPSPFLSTEENDTNHSIIIIVSSPLHLFYSFPSHLTPKQPFIPTEAPKPRSQARSMTIRIDAKSTMRNWKTSSRWGNTIYLCNFHSKDTTALSVTWTIFQPGFEKHISAFNSKSHGANFLGFVRLLPRGSHTRHPHLGE